MEKGLIFALLAAVAFAANTVYVRKAASQTGESFTSVVISVYIGILFFTALVFFSGEWSKLWSISWQGFALLGTAGIIHFVVGRLLVYNAVRLIGANKASALLRTSTLYAVILGVVFLNESITISLVLGVLFILVGATLVSIERKGVKEEKQGGGSSTEVKGILVALVGALCWGTSSVLVRQVVREIGSPFAAIFVSYLAASIVLSFFFFRKQHREQMVQFRSTALIPLAIIGITVSLAQLLNYIALSYSPASMVAPLVGTSIFLVLLFSFLLNRKIEIFTVKVISGMAIAAAGAFFIFS